jgi:probable addiction module antidote protein
MQKNGSDYKADLLDDLRNPNYAAHYLSAALDESLETFLLALRDVAEAHQGLAKVADRAELNRENLYRMLSVGGNPRLSSLSALLQALHLKISVNAEPRGRRRLRAERRSVRKVR